MPITHVPHNDPRHVVQADPVHSYTCTGCSATQNLYGGAPFCDVCQKYMVESGGVSINQATEIKNRDWIPDDSEKTPENAGRMGRYDEGLVPKALSGRVASRNGGSDLQILINLDREMFSYKQVLLRMGNKNVLTSIEEIGAAFTPFDSTSIATKVGNTIKNLPRKKPQKAITHIGGEITVLGATSSRYWKDMWATFTMKDGTTSVYAMPDIAQVIAKAL